MSVKTDSNLILQSLWAPIKIAPISGKGLHLVLMKVKREGFENEFFIKDILDCWSQNFSNNKHALLVDMRQPFVVSLSGIGCGCIQV